MQPPVPYPHAQQTKSLFMGSEAIGPNMVGYFLTWSALKIAAQILIQNDPEGFSNLNYFGHFCWFIVHPGVPQLNLPRSGLFTFMKVPGIGPNLIPKLFPSTLLKS